ncbi:MAG: hypothetical protein E6Q90_13695 [Actinobacteria bacterium]|nr:MAG: hypothetical protein E6Q90_13695 [Actinomycetota bacterium]
MYGWLWRNLPGGTAAKTAQAVVAVLAVLTLLFLVVFPWASQHVPFLQVTVEQPGSSASPAPASPSG